MFSKTPFRRILLFALTVYLALAFTACNRKNDDTPSGLSNPTAAIQGMLSNLDLTNATFTLISPASFTTPPSPAEVLASFAANNPAIGQPAAFGTNGLSMQGFALNSSGQNLARQAIPSASSYWPWPLPYGANGEWIWLSPDKAIDGDLYSVWNSHFGDGYNAWYRLIWAQPVTIGRIFLNDPLGRNGRGHTVNLIMYFNLTTNSWAIIPNSAFHYGPPYPLSYDFSFSPVTTTGIILYISVGPLNPHPNAAVMITELEVYGGTLATGSLKITSPTANDVFGFNESINFIGSQTGTVTNIEWAENGATFAQGLSTSKSDLSPGTHTITLRGISAGSPIVSDPITFFVIKSIKIKDFETGQPPVEPFKMSSIRGIKKFQAIGCFGDNGTNEFKPVKVKWSLPDGDLDPAHTMKKEILNLLNSYKGKIGVLAVPNGTDTVMLDSDTATFVSYFSGNITLKAEFRVEKTHSVNPKTLGIGLKQPVVNFSVKYFAEPSPAPILLIPIWVQKMKTILGMENIIDLQEAIPSFPISNEEYQPLPQDQSGEYLFTASPTFRLPSLINPLVTDAIADKYYDAGNLGWVVPRQTEELFKRRVSNRNVINLYVSDAYFDVKFEITATEELPKLFRTFGGISIFSPEYYKRSFGRVLINDKDDGGIILTKIMEFSASPELRESEENHLAHELGHALGLDHRNGETPPNLMDELFIGNVVQPDQLKILLDYEHQRNPDSFFIVEN